ncbi:hypothetical protein NQ317_008711 [Molorchus minor]|uniref:Uncharacterized protein n=1 Tax=Molorchus minor TaxID=1323400 RepID=A0ABQ9JGL5_9CUCU|nr:hypothetical protein NQ317_008711 [Molorchus minor]
MFQHEADFSPRGRKAHNFYENLKFTHKRLENGRRAAQCTICKALLKNTSIARLHAHRFETLEVIFLSDEEEDVDTDNKLCQNITTIPKKLRRNKLNKLSCDVDPMTPKLKEEIDISLAKFFLGWDIYCKLQVSGEMLEVPPNQAAIIFLYFHVHTKETTPLAEVMPSLPGHILVFTGGKRWERKTRLSRDNEEYPPYQQVNCQEQTISRIAYRPMHVNDNPNVHTPGNGTKSVSSVVTMDDGTGGGIPVRSTGTIVV